LLELVVIYFHCGKNTCTKLLETISDDD
jgi:hypothetical protein